MSKKGDKAEAVNRDNDVEVNKVADVTDGEGNLLKTRLCNCLV